MAHKDKPVRVAIDSNLFISLFLDEDENLNDRTEAVLGYDGFDVVLSTLVGINASEPSECAKEPALALSITKKSKPPADSSIMRTFYGWKSTAKSCFAPVITPHSL